MTKPHQEPDIYVGYLPTPAAHRRFLMALVPLLVLIMLASAYLIASQQRDPGATDIASGIMESWTGTVFSEPSPILVTETGETHLIMGIGKFGVRDRIAPYDAHRCTIDGWRLARNDRRGIQLALDADAIRPDSTDQPPAPKPVQTQGAPVRLVGEIVDGKCYIGAMKPGDGKGHKACAILCISGGLPPLFAASGSDQPQQLPLVLVDGRSVLPEELVKLAGETVILEGELSTLGSLSILETSIDRVARWTPDAAITDR